MCITAFKSILDCTHIGVWDINHPVYGYRHVLAYQNRVKNLYEGANCMLLHIPSEEPLSPEDLVDTSEHVELLRDLYEYLEPSEENENLMFMDASPVKERTNHVIEQGVYHIALLNDLKQASIEGTLQQIPLSKRPHIDLELIEFFKAHFPDFPIVLCCFNSQEAAQAAPMMVHFTPKYPEKLMANTLDSHGGIPNLNRLLDYHQHVIFGTYRESSRKDNVLKKVPENFHTDLSAFLPKTIGLLDTTEFSSINLPNKDICIDLRSVNAGDPPEVTLELLGSKEVKHKTDVYRKAFLDWKTMKSIPNSIFGIGDCYPRR